MINFKTNSIRQKLFNWLLILLLPLLILSKFYAYYMANYFANLAYDRTLFRVALALADQVEVRNGQMVVDLPQSTLNLIEYDKDDWIYYQIQDQYRHLLIGEEKLIPPKVMPAAGKHVYYNATLDGKELRIVAFNLPLTGTSATGNATILIGETTAKRDIMANEIITVMLIPQVILVILLIFLVYIGIKRGLISLDQLKDQIARRLPHDTQPIEEHAAPQELQPLVHAMNELLVKVKGAVDERQQFIANAAHQLKTPLAGLKIQAEAALRESDIVSVQHALKQISMGSDNLGRLASQLLSLARAEPNQYSVEDFRNVDLVKLFNEITADWVPKALDKAIDLGVSCDLGQLQLKGNPVLLQELLNNLIDNAIRYSPRGAKITVSLQAVKDKAILSVLDNGPGIADSEKSKVFERFYRVLGTDESGCGLGLAIVREIAHQHHAHVQLTYTDVKKSTGTTVKVVFPIQV
ncbi:MAG: sensor histidine kinase N-terminal domain-containing protein [Methylotenera sp.]|nr:sensor histidine kinase N-terminal domain-containing protein [Methylotenera sp.]